MVSTFLLLFMGIIFFSESLSSLLLFSILKEVHPVVEQKISLQALQCLRIETGSFCFKFVLQTGKCGLVGFDLTLKRSRTKFVYTKTGVCLDQLWTNVKSESIEADLETVKGGYLNIFFFSIYLFSKANLIFIYIYYTYKCFQKKLCRAEALDLHNVRDGFVISRCYSSVK